MNRRLMELCPLTAADIDHLTGERGLSSEQVTAAPFGRLPTSGPGRRRVLETLEREFGRPLLLKIPGIKEVRSRLDFTESRAGLLIGHRDGESIAWLQLRLDTPGPDEERYATLSGGGGPKAELCAYVVAEDDQRPGVAIVTEGAFKALAAAAHYGALAIGCPGASSIRRALAPLQEHGIKEVLLAYDADHVVKKGVYKDTRRAVDTLRSEGYTVRLLLWDGDAKGVDDAIRAGAEPWELEGEAVDAHLRAVAESLGLEVAAEGDQVAPARDDPLSPLASLEPEYAGNDLRAALRKVAAAAEGLDAIDRACLQSDLIRHLKRIKAPEPTPLARLTLGNSSDEAKEGGPRIRPQEPCPEAVCGANVLDQVEKLLLRFAILPDGASVAIPLWLLHTYLVPYLNFTPRLAVLSPVKRCGKSTLLNLLQELAEKAMVTSSVTAAALFRAMDAFSPTIIADEADTWLKENEELRGVVNTGFHRPNAYIHRCQGDSHELKSFATFGAMAIAGIGRLPDTIQDRSIIISMRRKRPGETVERLRQDALHAAAKEVKPRLARWAADNAEEMRAIEPDLPKALHDRAADCWEPLLAIADLAGGHWPKRARQAALLLSGANAQEDEDIGVMLLADIRDIFERRRTDRIRSHSLLENLCSLEERPWCEWKKGQPLSPRGLSNLLRPFGVSVKNYRDNFGEQGKGYLLECFEDAFGRYLGGPVTEQKKSSPEVPPNLSVTSVTTSNGAGLRDFLSVTSPNPVTDRNMEETAWLSRVTDVTDRNRGSRERKSEEVDPDALAAAGRAEEMESRQAEQEEIPLADLLGDLL